MLTTQSTVRRVRFVGVCWWCDRCAWCITYLDRGILRISLGLSIVQGRLDGHNGRERDLSSDGKLVMQHISLHDRRVILLTCIDSLLDFQVDASVTGILGAVEQLVAIRGLNFIFDCNSVVFSRNQSYERLKR